MQQITKEYILLFNAITDAEIILQNLHKKLVIAQQMAEELYISSENSIDDVSPTEENPHQIPVAG